MRVLSGSNSDTVWLQRLSNCSMTDDIIRSGRFFDEADAMGSTLLHVLDSLWDVPDLCKSVRDNPDALHIDRNIWFRIFNSATSGCHTAFLLESSRCSA
jgi:hypothetical protein